MLCLLLLFNIAHQLNANDDLEYIEREEGQLGVPDVIFIGVHGDYKLYIDGDLQNQNTMEGLTAVYMVEYKQSHLVAVELKKPLRGQDKDSKELIEPGFIASIETVVSSEVSVSNSRWRCTNKKSNLIDNTGILWTQDSFVDTSWSAAEVLAGNGEEPFGVAVDVASQAKWIWADVPASKVFCRGWLSSGPDTLHIVSQGHMQVYVDNALVGSGHKPGAKYSFTVPCRPLHLIAVEVNAEKKNKHLGVIASLQMPAHPNGVSGDLWKCISSKHILEVEGKAPPNWFSIHYDDSEWPAAKLVGKHGDLPWGWKLEVSRHASWVWTKENSDTVYCRSRMTSECIKMSSISRMQVPKVVTHVYI